jgi:hypothetical protein
MKTYILRTSLVINFCTIFSLIIICSQYIHKLENCETQIERCINGSDSTTEAFFQVYTHQEKFFYPDDVYRKLKEEGMPDSLAYMFTQIAIKESGYGLNSQIANKFHNYWGRRDTLSHKKFMKFESNEEAIKYMAYKFSKCPNKDKYLWLKEDLKWCPGCKNYYKQLRTIKF